MVPENDVTFEELSKWYLDLEVVKGLKDVQSTKDPRQNLERTLWRTQVNCIKKSSIENFRTKMLKTGKSRSYIDQIVGAARAMINKAFEDDMLSGDCLRPFKKIKKLLKKNANARDMIFTQEQYDLLIDHLPATLIPIVATAYWTGMRKGEILSLTWNKVFMKDREIRLEIEDTKDDEKRVIPIPRPAIRYPVQIPRTSIIRMYSFTKTFRWYVS
jgi:integrase